MEKVNTQGKMFKTAYVAIKNVIPFDQSWMNNEGYFSRAVRAVKLLPGQTGKSKDELGRRIILIGTRFGTVVVFDRYAEQDQGGNYSACRPRSQLIQKMSNGKEIGIGEMAVLIGAFDNLNDNIGFAIEKIANEFN